MVASSETGALRENEPAEARTQHFVAIVGLFKVAVFVELVAADQGLGRVGFRPIVGFRSTAPHEDKARK